MTPVLDVISHMPKILFLSIFIFFIVEGLFAQEVDPISNTTRQDSIGQKDAGLFDSGNKNTFKVLFSGNPGKAAFYSLVIPGGGQLYNRRYWKIPLVYAGLGAVSYLFWRADQGAPSGNPPGYQHNKNEYIKYVIYNNIQSLQSKSGSLLVQAINESVPLNNFAYYQEAKKTREEAIFAIIGVYLFNVFDAYIDRHLIDFDLDENLSFQLNTMPDPISPIGISVYYTIK